MHSGILNEHQLLFVADNMPEQQSKEKKLVS